MFLARAVQQFFFQKKMFLYVASSDYFRIKHSYKMGCTEYPKERLATYRTGCPPDMDPSCDIGFDLIYETFAKDREELSRYEDELHDNFVQWRLVREIPGDSEWFRFEASPIEQIQSFMESKGWKRVEVEEVPRNNRLLRPYKRNFKIIKTSAERVALLDKVQSVEISKIIEFIQSAELAATVIAPCGFGKTRITVCATKDVKRMIICCPTRQIQNQWCKALNENCMCVGGKGSTDEECIRSILKKPEFVVVATYASCHLLKTAIYDLLVLDEVHHMAGLVGESVGRTRTLLEAAIANKIKRLCLTFTPRYVTAETTHFSMDNEEIFGKVISKITFRYMVDIGLLPDYRVWCLRDEEREGSGVLARAACILEAWRASEIVRGETRPILHHLLVYAATLEEASVIETFFKASCSELVLNVKGGDDTEAIIAQFTAAKRAIMISVYKLSEGADVPVSNAVAFACVKHAIGQTTQFMLRPGRWYEGKDVFHIIIPALGEDMSGFETVLSALAQTDHEIHDEIIARSTGGGYSSKTFSTAGVEAMPQRIIMEGYASSPTEMSRCFSKIHSEGVRMGWVNVQKQCIKHGIKTSVAYSEWKPDNYPSDPRPKNMSWFKFLNPDKEPIPIQDFASLLVAKGLDDAKKYEAGRDAAQPSVQEICDGYFGEKNCNFNVIYGSVASRRR